MSAESGWVGTAIGVAVGTFGWVVRLGDILWPEHPQWALFLITICVSAVSTVILERDDRRIAMTSSIVGHGNEDVHRISR